MRPRAFRPSLLGVIGLLLAGAGCGSPPPAENPPAAETESQAEDPASSEASSDVVSDPEPVRPNCEDGTCFECGNGLCPEGAYCDASAPGGPACAWIQECPGSPSCACLKKVLGMSCSCDDDAGGPTVSCT